LALTRTEAPLASDGVPQWFRGMAVPAMLSWERTHPARQYKTGPICNTTL